MSIENFIGKAFTCEELWRVKTNSGDLIQLKDRHCELLRVTETSLTWSTPLNSESTGRGEFELPESVCGKLFPELNRKLLALTRANATAARASHKVESSEALVGVYDGAGDFM